MPADKLTVGSLFSGIRTGGLDLGLERAGFEIRWMVEIDPFCQKVLAKHWPGVKRYGDIRKLTGDELEPVDLICGGYPCQPFSQAGKRGGESDPRHLWPEFARLLRVLRPRFVLLENVPGHLSLGFGAVLGDLAGLGYDAEWTCLRASDFGASHIRKRVFVVAYRAGCGCELRPRLAGIQGEAGSQESVSPIGVASVTLADAGDGQLQEPGRGPQGGDGAGSAGAILADCGSGQPEQFARAGARSSEAAGGWASSDAPGCRDGLPGFAPGPSDPRWPAILRERPDLAPAGISYPAARTIARTLSRERDNCYPKRGRKRRRKQLAVEIALALVEGVAWEKAAVKSLRRMAYEFPGGIHGVIPYIEAREWLGGLNAERLEAKDAMKDRTKRLKALGNAVVPACAEYIGRRILEAER